MQALPLTDSERSWHPSNSDLNLSKQEPPEGSDASAVTARMDALTKLTDRPNEHPDRNISLVNPESTDSWRSFLPRNDPLLAGRDNNSSALTDETQESWRSFLAVPTTLPDAKDTHDIFFGPPENPIPCLLYTSLMTKAKIALLSVAALICSCGAIPCRRSETLVRAYGIRRCQCSRAFSSHQSCVSHPR